MTEGEVVRVASGHDGPLMCTCLCTLCDDLMYICAGHSKLHKKVQSEDGRSAHDTRTNRGNFTCNRRGLFAKIMMNRPEFKNVRYTTILRLIKETE